MSKAITYLCGGREMTAQQLISSAPKAPPKSSMAPKRTTDRDAATVSGGFVVSGYPADFMASVHAEYARRIKAAEASVKERHPGTIDEFLVSWKRHNKPRRIGRPYSLAQAADTCAELARKAGWLDVHVEELMKA
jgi:hypothetical protein